MALEKEDILALISILQKGLEDEQDPEQLKKVGSKKRAGQKVKTKNTDFVSNNKFDSMPEKNLHKKDTEIDKKLWGNNIPTERSRQSSIVSVRCRVCGKTEQVSATIIDSAERYKCNKCATTSG
jgi:hypothetical protein